MSTFRRLCLNFEKEHFIFVTVFNFIVVIAYIILKYILAIIQYGLVTRGIVAY